MSYVLLLCSHPLLCPTASRQTNGSHRRPSSWGLVAYWLLTQQPQLIYLHFEGKCKHAVKCALMFPLCTCIWDKQRFWINISVFLALSQGLTTSPVLTQSTYLHGGEKREWCDVNVGFLHLPVCWLAFREWTTSAFNVPLSLGKHRVWSQISIG